VPYADVGERRAMQLRRYHSRQERVRELKGPCVQCGFDDHRAIDFHHRDPATKVASINSMVKRNVPWDEVEAEIAKCDALCANCHRLAHYAS